MFLDLYFDLGLDGFALLLSLSRFGLHLLGSGSLMVGACSGPARWLDNRELATQFVDFSNLFGVCNNSTTIVTTRWSQLLFIVRRCYRCTARDVSINVHSVLMPLHTADVQPRGPEASNHSSLFRFQRFLTEYNPGSVALRTDDKPTGVRRKGVSFLLLISLGSDVSE